jgi:hypothetical protein
MSQALPNKVVGPRVSDPGSRLPPLSELRHVTFSKDALIMALKLYFAGCNQPLPAGTVESCIVEAVPDIGVTIAIRDDASGTLNKVTVAAEKIGAAMITYCRQVNVPLPRAGQKSLLTSGENLILMVQVRAAQTKLFKVNEETT